MSLETDIDDLYKGPLGEFTAARNALARTLTGGDAKRVKALTKPTVVPWTVNQLYWHGRQAYTRLMAAGEALREAQIAALEGKTSRLPKAAEAHKAALAMAVKEATRLAARDAARPNADEISRTLEALSLAAERRSPPGRLTEAVAPAGFEALAGMSIAVPKAATEGHKQKEKEETAKKAAAARRRELEGEIEAAERDLERAKSSETLKREALERATEERRRAEAALTSLRSQLE